MEGHFLILRKAYISIRSLLLGLKHFKKIGVGEWWSKGILEFSFGPNLLLRHEARTKLNNAMNNANCSLEFLRIKLRKHNSNYTLQLNNVNCTIQIAQCKLYKENFSLLMNHDPAEQEVLLTHTHTHRHHPLYWTL